MRPSDENQAPFMRPNLMSSHRRGGLEDSILARLERDPARRARVREWLRMAGIGTAAVAVLGLTTTLVWLASGNDGTALARSAAPADPPALAAPPLADTAPDGTQAQPALAALIVEPPAETIPPLRLLEPAPARAAPSAPASTTVANPPRAQARTAPRTARSEARAPAKARQAVRAPARNPARNPATINPVRMADSADDSDVALISAVIYHANGHASGQPSVPDNAACKDKNCRPASGK